MRVSLLLFAFTLCPFACLRAQTSALTPTPTSLSFTWQIGSALPAAQTIAVKAGSSTAAYTATISPSSAFWITVSPSAGTLPASLSVLVNPSSLPVGTYAAVIQVAAVGFSSTLNIPISLTVEQPLPTLALSTSSLSFTTPPNPPASQTLQLTTTGGPVPFTAAVQSATWMSITPSSGVVLPGAPFTITVSVDNTGLDPNSVAYTGKIAITASGVPSSNKTQNVNVSLLVNSLTPTITSLWPNAVLVGSPALTITIRGTGFYKGTTVEAAGSPTPLKTTFVNATTMLATLPSTMLATAGPLSVVVSNPPPGGSSLAATFTVSSTPVVQAIVSAASYATGPVSPGELVTIFGTGIGPAAPAGMSIVGGYVTQTLNSVSVTIDGKNAAMIYVSQNQITVQVPYTVTIGTARAVIVNNNGTIASGLVDTTNTAPGLFALDGSGLGQCAALVFSMTTGTFSVNGSSSPAHVGDVIVLYLTGEGIYTSISPATGYIIPATLNPLPQLTQPPSVTIGGVAATVQYAGPVVGGMLGVLQINAVVPSGTTTGTAVPVAVSIGTGTTQAGATIVVK